MDEPVRHVQFDRRDIASMRRLGPQGRLDLAVGLQEAGLAMMTPRKRRVAEWLERRRRTS